jgi:hypothetical protein
VSAFAIGKADSGSGAKPSAADVKVGFVYIGSINKESFVYGD